MKVLVTGASGYIGSYVLPLLVARGHEVHALSSRAQTNHAGIRWIKANLLDVAETAGAIGATRPEAMLHLAWYAEHGRFWTAPQNFSWSSATTGLLEAFRQAGGRRVVIGGSCAEYDWSYGYCVEDRTPAVPRTVYGKCKDATRQFTQAFCQAHGLECAWARIFFPYGPGEPPARLLPSVLRSLKQRETVRCSHGRQFRDFMHVSDVASALVHLTTAVDQSGIFNVASGEPMRVSTLVNLCASHFEDAPPIAFGAIPVPESEPPMLVGSADKLQASGWRPQISVADGIASYVKTYVV
jgi:nucleoside-diphosphate-sugar epimerase